MEIATGTTSPNGAAGASAISSPPRRRVGPTAWRGLLVFACTFFILSGCGPSPWKVDQAARHADLGQAFLNTGQYAAALKELLEAQELTPDDARIHYFLGIAYLGKGLNEKAVEEFQVALSLKPDYSEVQNYLGTAYFEMGLWDKAIEAFKRALANVLYETPSVALYNMGRVYIQKGDFATALAKFSEAINREPAGPLRPVIEKDMGIILTQKGQTDEAIAHLNQAIRLQPAFPEAFYWLGQAYLKQNRRKEAKDALQKTIQLAPGSEFGARAKDVLKGLKD